MTQRTHIRRTVYERVRHRITLAPNGCWVCSGLHRTGYAVMGFTLRDDGVRKQVRVHKAIWEELNGPVPVGLVLDHYECDNPPCVNPLHLRACTSRENTLRSQTSPSAVNARRTHCVRGHTLVPNPHEPGKRWCPVCHKMHMQRRQEEKREVLNAYARAWNQANRDKVSEYNRRAYLKRKGLSS